MFCDNCKKQLPDGTAVCPDCGAPVTAPAEDISSGSEPEVQLESSKARPVLIVIACFLSLVLMFLVAFSVFFNNPRSVAKRYVKAAMEGNLNTVFNCSLLNKKITETMFKDDAKAQNMTPEEYYANLGSQYGVEAKNMNGWIKAASEELRKEAEKKYGKYSVSVKVTAYKDLDKDNLLILKNALEENYKDYIKANKISRAAEVTVEYTVKGKDQSETDAMTVTVVRYGMSWRISPLDLKDTAKSSPRIVYDGRVSDDPGVYYDDYEDYSDYDRYIDYGSANR